MADDYFHAPKDSAEYNELFAAASQDDIARLKSALLPSININALDADRVSGCTALHNAAYTGNVAAIRLLLAHSAQVDIRNCDGWTPLHVAANALQLDAIKVLLELGADITLEAQWDVDYTMLDVVLLDDRQSLKEARIKTIEFLLDQGCDPNRDDGCGMGGTMVGLHRLWELQ